MDIITNKERTHRATLTIDRYAKEIVDKIVEWERTYHFYVPFFFNVCDIFCESADKLFRQALSNELQRRRIYITVNPSYKKDGIVARIRLECILINQGRLKIMNHMKQWIEAYENAVWDADEKAKGEWVRVDDGSYPVDCLDSGEYGIQPYARYLEV